MADVPELQRGDKFAALGLLVGPYSGPEKDWKRPVLDRLSTMVGELAGDATLPAVIVAMSTLKVPERAFASGQPSIHQLFSHLGHYTSTYCLHAMHEDCRLTCKQDVGELCNCWCHSAL